MIFVVTKGSGDAGTLDLNAKKLEITGSEISIGQVRMFGIMLGILITKCMTPK